PRRAPLAAGPAPPVRRRRCRPALATPDDPDAARRQPAGGRPQSAADIRRRAAGAPLRRSRPGPSRSRQRAAADAAGLHADHPPRAARPLDPIGRAARHAPCALAAGRVEPELARQRPLLVVLIVLVVELAGSRRPARLNRRAGRAARFALASATRAARVGLPRPLLRLLSRCGSLPHRAA